MSFDATLPLVMLAAYGICNLLLSAAVVIAWRAGLRAHLAAADTVLGVRLLPAAGSAALVLTVILPAFFVYEPRHAHDQPGPLLVISALFALLLIADGVRRGWRAWRTTRALLPSALPHPSRPLSEAAEVTVVNVAQPLVGVVGSWRQRIIAARSVAAACDREEFRQVLAHEAAHMDARDNLKLLMLLAMPDPLAWLPTGSALREHWRAATELEADERASGSDPRKRVALASALIKVARLSLASSIASSWPGNGRPRAAAAESGGLERRIRRLLAPTPAIYRSFPGRRLLTYALLVPLLAMPLYSSVHRLIEVLVAFGR
jgi:Zn-dependent protease with chaperone function